MGSPGRTQHGIHGAILRGVVKAWNDEGAGRPSGSAGSVKGVRVHGSPYLGYLCFGGKLALIQIRLTLLPTPHSPPPTPYSFQRESLNQPMALELNLPSR
jgi:hypothetical protein